MKSSKLGLATFAAALLLQVAVALPTAYASRMFEAIAHVDRVDATQGYIVLDGHEYRLGPTVQVYGTAGAGRYQLKRGQRVSFKLDTRRQEPIITDISIMDED